MADLTLAQRNARKKKGPARLFHVLALSLVALFLAGCLEDAADTTFAFCVNPNEPLPCSTSTGTTTTSNIIIFLVDPLIEVVIISNWGTALQDFTNWVLTAAVSGDEVLFPSGFSLAAGRSVRVFSGTGDLDPDTLFWEGSNHISDTENDRILLKNDSGQTIATCATNDPCWNN
ncbi:MAG: lamin tail domain-containing protein [SAR324 cluster bacterium]|nr:lamin tail domain-containing protein [SAR324 cluster bacterium]